MALCPHCRETLLLHVETAEAEFNDRLGSIAARVYCCRRCGVAIGVEVDKDAEMTKLLRVVAGRRSDEGGGA